MYATFCSSTRGFGGDYGVAILSRWPVLESTRARLSGWRQRGSARHGTGPLPQVALAVRLKPERFTRDVWVVSTQFGDDPTGQEQLFEMGDLVKFLATLGPDTAIASTEADTTILLPQVRECALLLFVVPVVRYSSCNCNDWRGISMSYTVFFRWPFACPSILKFDSYVISVITTMVWYSFKSSLCACAHSSQTQVVAARNAQGSGSQCVPWGYLRFGPIEIILCVCDLCAREKA